MIYGNKIQQQLVRNGGGMVRMVAAAFVCGLAAFALGRCTADWLRPAEAQVIQTAYLQAPAADGYDGNISDGQAQADLLAAAQAQTEAERIEALKAYEQADFDFMRGVVYEPVDQ